MAIAGYEFPHLDTRIDNAAAKAPGHAQLPEEIRNGHQIYLDRLYEQRENAIRALGQETLFTIERQDILQTVSA